MKQLFIVFFAISVTTSFGQNSQTSDSIQQPIYDTTSIDVQSLNSFYFCSKLYAIPRNCDNKDLSKCCVFRKQIIKLYNERTGGQLNCDDGTSLFWSIFKNEELAKQSFEGLPPQIKKQSKKYKHETIKFFVCDKPVTALKMTCTTLQGYNYIKYMFYGTINGQSILGELSFSKKINSSKELAPLFQQLVRF